MNNSTINMLKALPTRQQFITVFNDMELVVDKTPQVIAAAQKFANSIEQGDDPTFIIDFKREQLIGVIGKTNNLMFTNAIYEGAEMITLSKLIHLAVKSVNMPKEINDLRKDPVFLEMSERAISEIGEFIKGDTREEKFETLINSFNKYQNAKTSQEMDEAIDNSYQQPLDPNGLCDCPACRKAREAEEGNNNDEDLPEIVKGLSELLTSMFPDSEIVTRKIGKEEIQKQMNESFNEDVPEENSPNTFKVLENIANVNLELLHEQIEAHTDATPTSVTIGENTIKIGFAYGEQMVLNLNYKFLSKKFLNEKFYKN